MQTTARSCLGSRTASRAWMVSDVKPFFSAAATNAGSSTASTSASKLVVPTVTNTPPETPVFLERKRMCHAAHMRPPCVTQHGLNATNRGARFREGELLPKGLWHTRAPRWLGLQHSRNLVMSATMLSNVSLTTALPVRQTRRRCRCARAAATPNESSTPEAPQPSGRRALLQSALTAVRFFVPMSAPCRGHATKAFRGRLTQSFCFRAGRRAR